MSSTAGLARQLREVAKPRRNSEELRPPRRSRINATRTYVQTVTAATCVSRPEHGRRCALARLVGTGDRSTLVRIGSVTPDSNRRVRRTDNAGQLPELPSQLPSLTATHWGVGPVTPWTRSGLRWHILSRDRIRVRTTHHQEARPMPALNKLMPRRRSTGARLFTRGGTDRGPARAQ
jgi:hypothetical protein